MKKEILKYSAIIMSLGYIYSSAAQAVGFTYSDKTKKNAVIFDVKGSVNLPFNLYVSGGAEVMPSYSSIVGPLSNTSGAELWSVMTNPEINVGYNFNLVNAETAVGNFDPTLTPYVGYKHFFAHTGSGGSIGLTGATLPTTSLSNIGGINYGLRFTTNIPLGFYVYADAGATSLLNGGWTQENPTASGTINGNGLFLPHAGLGATFNLFNLLTLRAGYKLLYVPDIRTPNAPLNDSSKNLIHSLDVGLSFLFFSI